MRYGFLISTAMLFSLVLAGFALAGDGLTRASMISYSDPTGDVDNDGMSNDAVSNIDIVSVSADTSSDPYVFELTVDGVIIYENTDLYYTYAFYLDHSGDGTSDSNIDVSTLTGNIFSSEYDTELMRFMSDEVSGNGTSTLTVEIPASWFGEGQDIVDIYVDTDVNDLWNYADDTVNEYFEGGGGTGDDDTGDDDTGDDDTGDDDIGDDDTGDDDTGGDVEWYLPSGEDPADAEPTNTGLDIDIGDFDVNMESDDESYEMTMSSDGTADSDVVHAAYTIVMYGEGDPQTESWTEGPVDEDFSYGDMSFEQRFQGTGTGGSWSDWEIYWYSAGTIDESNEDQYDPDSDYYEGLDSVVLYVRVFDSDGGWNQASKDITKEYTGRESSGGDGDGDDGDSPAPGLLFIIAPAVLLALLSFTVMRRRR